MVKNQPTIDAFMDRRWSSEYHFLSKLYNKLLHRPTNDVVNFRGRGWVECACIRWERSRKRMPPTILAHSSCFNFRENLHTQTFISTLYQRGLPGTRLQGRVKIVCFFIQNPHTALNWTKSAPDFNKNYVRNLHFLKSKLPQKKTKPLEHKCFRYCDGPHILSQQKKPLSKIGSVRF